MQSTMADVQATRLRNQVTHCPLFLNQVLVTTADSTALQTGIMKTQESIIVLTITILIIIILVVTDKDPDTDLIMFTMMKEIEGKISHVSWSLRSLLIIRNLRH